MDNELEKVRLMVVKTAMDRLRNVYRYELSEPGLNGIPSFFQNYIYNPINKQERDEALEKLYYKIKTVAGSQMTSNIAKLIQLNQLTNSLDTSAASIILTKKLFTENGITQEVLERTTIEVGRFEERKLHIRIVGDVLTFFFSMTKLPMLRLILAPIKVSASIIGAHSMIETIEAGVDLSSKIKDLSQFTNIFVVRELEYIEKLESEAY